MRLLHVTRSLSAEGGGTSEAVRLLCVGLSRQGVANEVVSLDPPGESMLELDCPVHPLGQSSSGYGYSSKLVPWLREHAGRFDAVIVHGVWQYSSFGVWRALGGKGQRAKGQEQRAKGQEQRAKGQEQRARSKEARAKSQEHAEAHFSTCALTSSLHASSPSPLPPRPLPFFLFPHGMLDPWFKRTYPLKHLKKSAYWLLAESRVLRDAAAVIFTADEERRLARQSFRPYRCREAVAPLGIEMADGDFERQKEAFYQKWPELRGRRLILYLGRLHPKKGPEFAIQAFGEVLQTLPSNERKDWVLVMAGPVAGTGVDGAYLDSLRSLSSRLASSSLPSALSPASCPLSPPRPTDSPTHRLTDSPHILFPGMLQGDLKWGALHACDAFILPSHQENFGIAVVEALACGKPVLISNKVNIWREIEQDGAALVADDTLEGTRSLLDQWMRLPENDRQAMSERARTCFERRFDIAIAARRLLEVLRAKG